MSGNIKIPQIIQGRIVSVQSRWYTNEYTYYLCMEGLMASVGIQKEDISQPKENKFCRSLPCV